MPTWVFQSNTDFFRSLVFVAIQAGILELMHVAPSDTKSFVFSRTSTLTNCHREGCFSLLTFSISEPTQMDRAPGGYQQKAPISRGVHLSKEKKQHPAPSARCQDPSLSLLSLAQGFGWYSSWEPWRERLGVLSQRKKETDRTRASGWISKCVGTFD